jgi:hypothetical protein
MLLLIYSAKIHLLKQRVHVKTDSLGQHRPPSGTFVFLTYPDFTYENHWIYLRCPTWAWY